MNKEIKQAMQYYKDTNSTDFYSHNSHYMVVVENNKTYLIEKELYFGSPENKYEIK
jgi:hypothetical protein